MEDITALNIKSDSSNKYLHIECFYYALLYLNIIRKQSSASRKTRSV